MFHSLIKRLKNWHYYLWPIELIDLEKTYIGDFYINDSVSEIIRSKDYLYESTLLKDGRHVRFLNLFKDKINITDEELRKTPYYKAEFHYVKDLLDADEQALRQCRNFISLFECYKNKSHNIDFSSNFDGSLPCVFKIRHSSEYMILDGHHRLSCLYLLNKRKIEAKIAGTKTNRLQAVRVDKNGDLQW